MLLAPREMASHALEALRRLGPRGFMLRGGELLLRNVVGWAHILRCRLIGAPRYQPPNDVELHLIEQDLIAAGVEVEGLYVEVEGFTRFLDTYEFPESYYSNASESVRTEKLLEHYLAMSILDLQSGADDIVYLDVAACDSPWAKILRESTDIESYAIDLQLSGQYAELPYYMQQDATQTEFEDASVRWASLQCAYEMFEGDHDTQLITELARILDEGGKAVILPLYMHTHYCSYSSPEYFRRDAASSGALRYVRYDIRGVPSSRKYDVENLISRVLDECDKNGLGYTLYAIRNRDQLPAGVYCHFVFEVVKQ